MKKYWTTAAIAAALLAYSYFAVTLNFTQDDAYISYRYVANFLNGDDLVFNIGERIEGFTNFGWVIYLIFWGWVGFDYILISKLTGWLMGAGIVVLAGLIAGRLFGKSRWWLILLVTMLVGLNQSLAYWSVSGLETSAFAFFVVLSLYLFLLRSRALFMALLLSVWIRPEGALICGIILLCETMETRKLPRYSFRNVLWAFLFSLPLAVFKVIYYGSLFPNPLYAKTSWSVAQFQSGLEYTGLFLRDYGFFGVGLILPLLFWKKLSGHLKVVWLFTFLYALYVVAVGGDVLKVHRFYLPLFAPSAVLVAASLLLLLKRLTEKTQTLLVFAALLLMGGLTIYLPNKHVKSYLNLERAFTKRMEYMANSIKSADPSNFSVALPTIGIFGYTLIGHDIIDMVGLTDSTIARHADEPIPDMVSTWKETKHNSKYILSRAPDYIMFSTGVKPSAPAEKALLLYSQFMDAYITIGWFYSPNNSDKGTVQVVYKRARPIMGDLKPVNKLEYVENYKLGLDAYTRSRHREAISYYNNALSFASDPPYSNLLYQKGYSHMVLTEFDSAAVMFLWALEVDSMCFMAHRDLMLLSAMFRDSVSMEYHKAWVQKLTPWYWPRVEKQLNQILSNPNLRLGP